MTNEEKINFKKRQLASLRDVDQVDEERQKIIDRVERELAVLEGRDAVAADTRDAEISALKDRVAELEAALVQADTAVRTARDEAAAAVAKAKAAAAKKKKG